MGSGLVVVDFSFGYPPALGMPGALPPGAFYVHFYHGRSSVRLRLLVPPLFLILVAGGNLYRVGQLPWAMAFFSQGTKSMLH